MCYGDNEIGIDKVGLEMEWSSECFGCGEVHRYAREMTYDRDPRIIDKGKIDRELWKRIQHFDQIFSFFMLYLDARMD
jgi:hypothetical protein